MKFFRAVLTAALMGGLLCAAAGCSVQAQTWPSRPITMVIGFAAGAGPADAVGRLFAEYASKQLGQPVIIENKPGGGGIVGAIAASKAAPDGYTILFHAVGPMIFRPILDPAIGYDPLKDFSPIVLAVDVPTVIISGQKFASQSLGEVVDYAKKNPGALTVGHSGLGTAGHLAALLHASNAGMTNNYIGYRNGTEMITDILGGRIDVAYGAYIPQFKQSHILAVMTPERVEFLPEVPSMREAGFPGIYSTIWYALYGPPNTPADIVAKLNAVMNEFLRSDEGRKRLALQGIRTLGGSPVELTKRMVEDTTLWSKVIKDANIKLNDQQR